MTSFFFLAAAELALNLSCRSRFQDVAAVGKAVEQGGGHLGITEDAGPFAESEIGGDDDAGAFRKLAQQMEEQGVARGAER